MTTATDRAAALIAASGYTSRHTAIAEMADMARWAAKRGDDGSFAFWASQIADILAAFEDMDERLENADNFRVADIGDADQLAAYAEAQRNGCCGQHDRVVGRYLVGCNYGH